jgi:hypothetical protein
MLEKNLPLLSSDSIFEILNKSVAAIFRIALHVSKELNVSALGKDFRRFE